MLRRTERGYAMAALLVAMAVMAILLGVALPVWRTAVQREREAELVFRGEQYANAIAIFQRRTGGYPPSLDVLEKTRAIRKLYKDPITGGDFQPVFVGQMIGGAPVTPGQPGRGAAGQPGRGAAGPLERGRVSSPLVGRGQTQGPARGAAPGPFTAGGAGQTGFGTGQTGTPAAGPIIGVVSRSTANSLRLYNGRGKYNEWAFVAVETTQQAGGPPGAGNPGPPAPGRGGRGAQPDPFGGGRGQQVNPPGRGNQGPGGPRGLPFPGRGVQPPGRGFPGAPGGIQGFPPPGAPQP